MPLSDPHPLYSEMLPAWQKLAHCYEGEDRIKAEGTRYLPATIGMLRKGGGSDAVITSTPKAGTEGGVAYEAYKTRARFPDYVTDAVDKLNGLLHREPATIELPPQLEAMKEIASVDGESALALLRRITFHQLREGRYGLLTDIPGGTPSATAKPFIAGYVAPAIVNWAAIDRRDGTRRPGLVVLDESGFDQGDGMMWSWVKRYRVLAIDKYLAGLGVEAGDGDIGNPALYHSGETFDSDDVGALDWVVPQAADALSEIPFVFVGCNDLALEPCKPPLTGIANECLAIYRGEADLRQSLYLQGQATLVRTGITDNEDASNELGAGAVMDLPPNADAKYIGAPSAGISEQRQTLDADHARAATKSTQMLGAKSGQAESGVALQIRQAGATASLTQIANTAAEALATAFRHAARFVDADPELVKVEANTEFVQDIATTQEALQLWDIVSRGGLSRESWHRYCQRHDLTEKGYEEEQELIREDQQEWPSGAGSQIDPFAMQ